MHSEDVFKVLMEATEYIEPDENGVLQVRELASLSSGQVLRFNGAIYAFEFLLRVLGTGFKQELHRRGYSAPSIVVGSGEHLHIYSNKEDLN